MRTAGTPSLCRHDATAVSVTQDAIELTERPISMGKPETWHLDAVCRKEKSSG